MLVSSIVFVDAMLFGSLAPLLPGYAEEFGLSKAGAGLLVGAFGAGALLGGIPGGIAAMRLGPKRAVVLGLALLAVASFAFSLASGPWALGLARFVQGADETATGSLNYFRAAERGPRERPPLYVKGVDRKRGLLIRKVRNLRLLHLLRP